MVVYAVDEGTSFTNYVVFSALFVFGDMPCNFYLSTTCVNVAYLLHKFVHGGCICRVLKDDGVIAADCSVWRSNVWVRLGVGEPLCLPKGGIVAHRLISIRSKAPEHIWWAAGVVPNAVESAQPIVMSEKERAGRGSHWIYSGPTNAADRVEDNPRFTRSRVVSRKIMRLQSIFLAALSSDSHWRGSVGRYTACLRLKDFNR